MINLQSFEPDVLKIDKKSYQTLVFTTMDILRLKILVIMKVFTA